MLLVLSPLELIYVVVVMHFILLYIIIRVHIEEEIYTYEIGACGREKEKVCQQ